MELCSVKHDPRMPCFLVLTRECRDVLKGVTALFNCDRLAV